MTLREIALVLEGNQTRREYDLQVLSWALWQNNVWSRVKKLPRKPPDLSRKQKPQKPQSIDQMKSIARMWTAAMGGTVTKRQT